MIIDKVYIDREAEGAEITGEILVRLKNTPVEIVSDRPRFLERHRNLSVTEGKRNLWITLFKGPLVKACPATAESYLCCRYWTINAQTGCPLDCSYCVLQHYLNQPFLTIYANARDVFGEIDSLLAKEPQRLFRIGTGELTDSFALDGLTRWNHELIRYASSRPFVLELKTKVADVRALPAVQQDNVVISWSLNPDEIIGREEHKTSSVDKRIEAAQIAISKGYHVSFHFDPIIVATGCEDWYCRLIRRLTRMIPEEKVFWISLGSLRYPPALKSIIEKRFPKSTITQSELIRGLDGKMRYFRPLREKLYRLIYAELRAKWPNAFIYFCMEHPEVWSAVTGMAPENNGHLDFLFHENLCHRFSALKIPLPERSAY